MIPGLSAFFLARRRVCKGIYRNKSHNRVLCDGSQRRDAIENIDELPRDLFLRKFEPDIS